ncbi:DinB family protein [Bacillus sp. BRMEA1]|uniref:DinB family protein n=1 Tax=Neobacillus endophyticus TaxID=2738405 RepID=UPI001567690C|nr:DinB family protein [Neobacillus endophyticus]NRD79851.1 DinB family protein [Neobacillus endophyticus]
MLEIKEQVSTTRKELLSLLDGLSDSQLNWKPNENAWSIAQIVKHVATLEGTAAQIIQLGLDQEPNFAPSDIPLEKMILDRSKKFNAPERLHPLAEPKTLEQLKEMLHNSQEQFLSALNSIKDVSLLDKTAPPRPHPVFGQMSTNQWILAVPLHEQRHIKQIEEVKEKLQLS